LDPRVDRLTASVNKEPKQIVAPTRSTIPHFAIRNFPWLAVAVRVKAAPLMISPPRSITASQAALRSTRAAPARACSNF